MTTYFPSIFLLMITFATTFFKLFFFEAALTVDLTNMLAMTTIFISVMEKLPHTSYPKMIDYWLIFCQVVPFTEVILLTGQEYVRCEQDEMKEASTQTVQRIAGPGMRGQATISFKSSQQLRQRIVQMVEGKSR